MQTACRRALRSPLVLVAAFTLYWPIAGACDSLGGGLVAQNVIGVLTWLVLLAGIWHAPARLRLPATSMVVVATFFECVGSLLWGAYHYRYHNLPLYVPPGHGLFYLSALHLASLPVVRRHGQRIVAIVAVASAGWALHGLFLEPRADVLGAWCWLLLAYFLWRGRDPLLFALTFTLTMSLEFYGTALGCWHWAAVLPYTHVSAGNPPSAIGAGYCVLDTLAILLASSARPWLAGLSSSIAAGAIQAAHQLRTPALGHDRFPRRRGHGRLNRMEDGADGAAIGVARRVEGGDAERGHLASARGQSHHLGQFLNARTTRHGHVEARRHRGIQHIDVHMHVERGDVAREPGHRRRQAHLLRMDVTSGLDHLHAAGLQGGPLERIKVTDTGQHYVIIA